MPAEGLRRRLPLAGDRGGVAVLGLATESSHGTRVPADVLRASLELRAQGARYRTFLLHLRQDDVAENAARLQRVVERVTAGAFERVLLQQAWLPELAHLLERAGVAVERIQPGPADRGEPAWPAPGLALEVIGFDGRAQIENVDLTIGQACSYQKPVAGDGTYAEATTAHRGCAYCEGAMPSAALPADVTSAILDAVVRLRKSLPALRTLWIPFAETLFAPLREALEGSRDTTLFRGIDLAIQLRPDVLLREAPVIEAVAASAVAAGTKLRLALVGFESFAPRDLDVLHRGVTPDQLRAAAALLHDWRAHPRQGLDVRGCTPSFILFHPWTELTDLELNLREIRAQRLTRANVERLRISPAMPLHQRLLDSGLIDDAPSRLEVHPNGYTDEVAYRFADARVQSASDGFARLKPASLDSQPLLLEAVLRAVRGAPDGSAIDWSQVAAAHARLRETCDGLARLGRSRAAVDVPSIHRLLTRLGTEPGFPSREAREARKAAASASSSAERARFVVGEACNNGCSPCSFERRIDADAAIELPIAGDVRGRDVVLAGREPTLRPDLPALIRALKAGGAARVAIETNGRRLAYVSYARALADAGLDAVEVRLFGADPASWDAHTQVEGSFVQTLRGLATVALAAPSVTLSAVAYVRAEPGATLRELASLAAAIGIPATRFVLRLEHQDLLALDELREEALAIAGPGVSIATH